MCMGATESYEDVVKSLAGRVLDDAETSGVAVRDVIIALLKAE